jgi:hypothetical protein
MAIAFEIIFLILIFQILISVNGQTKKPTFRPTTFKPSTTNPSVIPTIIPSPKPSAIPTTSYPSYSPTRRPTTRMPSRKPTKTPVSSKPTFYPTSRPSARPTNSKPPSPLPTSQPSFQPSSQPTSQPSLQPSRRPTGLPSLQPTSSPSNPTTRPTGRPTDKVYPTGQPTGRPTHSRSPTRPTFAPSKIPTRCPTATPSTFTKSPSRRPSIAPSAKPTTPTSQPSSQPSSRPFKPPSSPPSSQPTYYPTQPTGQPSCQPSSQPIVRPSSYPTSHPTAVPSEQPSNQPTSRPSFSHKPTRPSSQPSGRPTEQPTGRPTTLPTITKNPTKLPSTPPTSRPSKQPSSQPSGDPSSQPTQRPSTPTGQPSRQPTTQPSCQPSRQPTSQPSRQPSAQPTFQPTGKPTSPTSQPSSKPTFRPSTQKPLYSRYPTSQPSSEPSRDPSQQPSSKPSSTPTTTYKPTFRPTSFPTSRPTSRPSPTDGFTAEPTYVYQRMSVTGSVDVTPDSLLPCVPVAINFTINFSPNITSGSIITVSTPGLTSGPCTRAVDGNDLIDMYMANTDLVYGKFYEGTFANTYTDSIMTFTLREDLLQNAETLIIYIDRSNGLRKACCLNTTWYVSVTPNDDSSHYGVVGYLDFQEIAPKFCYAYNSSLDFSMNRHQQFPVGINFSFQFGFRFATGLSISIYLPGFTNAKGPYPMNPDYNLTSNIIPNGKSRYLTNITSNSNFSWSVYYEQFPKPDVLSYQAVLKLTVLDAGNARFNRGFWVNIPGHNHLIPVCGHVTNSSHFRYSVTSDQFFINSSTFNFVTAIGDGCSHLNHCNNHGKCDYCTSRCICDDGYGSPLDLYYANDTNTFPADCSGRICPRGIATFASFAYTNRTDFPSVRNSSFYHGNLEGGNPHRLIECANNGICNRQTGQCQCFRGFTGAACERRICVDNCNHRGVCLSMQRLALHPEALPLSTARNKYAVYNASGALKTFRTWDAEVNHACVCDSSWSVGLGRGQVQQAEFFGPACEFRHCPSGDDPSTPYIDETNCTFKITSINGREKGEHGNLCHVDCSNRGICDYTTGICTCFLGYGGHNCGKIINIRS